MSFASGAASSVGGVGSSAADASKFSRGSNLKVAAEYDKEKRQAVVYLYTRPVKDFPDATAVEYQHWALVFGFEDGSWRTLEGMGNDDTKLAPIYTKERPEKDPAGKYRELGEVKVSPFELSQFAKTNEANGKPYNAVLHNCQNWVIKLAKKLGKAIEDKLEDYETIEEARPLVAALGGSVIAAKNTIGSSSRR